MGRRRLFHVLRNKVEQSRNRQLQSGAFMAMLLDSYVVQRPDQLATGFACFAFKACSRFVLSLTRVGRNNLRKGQPWWLRHDTPELQADAETTNVSNKPRQFPHAVGMDSKLSVSAESLATPPSLMPEMDMESRPDFIRARVAQVSHDGSVFWVQPEFSTQSVRVDRKQQEARSDFRSDLRVHFGPFTFPCS